jgi:hypothetical protein
MNKFSMKEKNYLICLIILTFISCTRKNNSLTLNGHWYLSNTSTQEHIPYLEFIVKDKIITRINKRGHVWDDCKIKIDSDSLIQIDLSKFKVESYSDKALTLSLIGDLSTEFYFDKLDDISYKEQFDQITFRKLLYNINITSISDTIRIASLKDDIWISLGGAAKELLMEEDSIK